MRLSFEDHFYEQNSLNNRCRFVSLFFEGHCWPRDWANLFFFERFKLACVSLKRSRGASPTSCGICALAWPSDVHHMQLLRGHVVEDIYLTTTELKVVHWRKFLLALFLLYAHSPNTVMLAKWKFQIKRKKSENSFFFRNPSGERPWIVLSVLKLGCVYVFVLNIFFADWRPLITHFLLALPLGDAKTRLVEEVVKSELSASDDTMHLVVAVALVTSHRSI